MTTEYSQKDIIEMISTLQEEQTEIANAKYNFERFIGKPIKSLSAIQNDVKVASELWQQQNRSVTIYEPNWELTHDEQFTAEYSCLADLIAARPNDIIKKISARGIFGLDIFI